MRKVSRGSGSAGALACLALALAGCGEGSSTSSPATVPTSPVASAQNTNGEAVASVAGTPIYKTSYEHWLTVERKLGGNSNASHRALGFLITSQWMVGEAAARHISVPETEVKQHYSQMVHQSFSKAGTLQKFFATSGENEADLLARIHVETLTSRITAQITAHKSSSQRTAVLTAFEKSFHSHWKALTSCQPGYVMEDCKQYKGGPENLTATHPSTAASSTSSASSSAGEPSVRPRSEKKRIEKQEEENSTKEAKGEKPSPVSAGGSNSSGELPAPYEGEFAVLSPAFGRNGAIPAEYTCAGKGISPPLEWQSVPKGAAALVLFVIDDTSSTSEGGQRWIVANIDPNSKGVAAGQTPAGGVVGTNTAGKATYSPICPAAGKSDTVEFVMYALSKKINVSPGFDPADAEAQYGQGKLLMGQAAVTYGVASR